jgi:hypothetical protein
MQIFCHHNLQVQQKQPFEFNFTILHHILSTFAQNEDFLIFVLQPNNKKSKNSTVFFLKHEGSLCSV